MMIAKRGSRPDLKFDKMTEKLNADRHINYYSDKHLEWFGIDIKLGVGHSSIPQLGNDDSPVIPADSDHSNIANRKTDWGKFVVHRIHEHIKQLCKM
jgi:hypothetical protein